MPKKPTQARIAFARIYIGTDEPHEKGEQLPLLIPLRDALLESLQAGTSTTRYGRTWHMAQYQSDGDTVTGRIGFDVEASAGWDEQAKDFRSVRPAQVSPFAIDLERMRVAFQLRGGAIRPWTFQGAFQALLNATETPHKWTVRLEGIAQPTWEDWLEEVTRITEVVATMQRPNPHYPSEEIEHLFEDAKLASATLGAKGDNIDPEGGILKAAISHTLSGYGKLRAKGVRVEGGKAKPDQWRSEIDSGVNQIEVPLNPETGELDARELPRALRPAEAEEG